jgi:MYXO-CTERM domain-containing protein
VVIEYDGASDCDDRDSARWSRDGDDRGTIEGITCSTGGPGGLGALALVLCLVVRRRRQ